MRTANQIMVTKLVTLDPETPVLDAIRKLIRSNVKGAPVVEADQRYLGIFTERCCLNVLSKLCDKRSWADIAGGRTYRCGDIMTKRLWTLKPEADVFDAVNALLRHRVSGVPVVDSEGGYLGIFSETCSMKVLIGAIYDSLPGAQVGDYMDSDPGRLIDEHLSIDAIVSMFLETSYRRLAVIREGRVVGQVSRNNVLSQSQALIQALAKRSEGSGRSWTASAFMDSRARTIDESTGIFSIADIFRATKQRRLPVLREGQLVGQITRKNLLSAENSILNPAVPKGAQPLYLAAVPDANPPGA